MKYYTVNVEEPSICVLTIKSSGQRSRLKSVWGNTLTENFNRATTSYNLFMDFSLTLHSDFWRTFNMCAHFQVIWSKVKVTLEKILTITSYSLDGFQWNITQWFPEGASTCMLIIRSMVNRAITLTAFMDCNNCNIAQWFPEGSRHVCSFFRSSGQSLRSLWKKTFTFAIYNFLQLSWISMKH